ncbi:MAG: cation diffusion facilitator family transporter [Phascolarctobacterium sp.]|nr:cation diffusion facilitator family transporter [Phascolarctobacterium sp.]
MNFANEEERLATIVNFNCVIGNLFLCIAKLIAGFMANSAAMISDAIHSASDVFGTLVVMAGVKISNRGADEDHPYGHDRMECVSAIIVAAILAAVGLGIGYSGVQKIFFNNGEVLEAPGTMALYAAIVSIVVKEAMYHYTINAANKLNSSAMRAAAWDHRSDALSSIGALLGIYGARCGYPILDPIASLVICVMIFHAAFEVFHDAMSKMVDQSADDETNLRIAHLVTHVPGVEHLDSCSTRLFASKIYVDMEISVKDDMTLWEAHNISEVVHAAIEANFPQVKHCMVHINPSSEKDHEQMVEIPDELKPENYRKLECSNLKHEREK